MGNLTDEQYFKCLDKISWILTDPDFKMEGEDSTCTGDKYTRTNFGMCNDEGLCDAENAMWPDQFPERKVLSYQEEWQLCPCDSRVFTYRSLSDLRRFQGCFYSCYYFTHRIKDHSIIRDLMLLGIRQMQVEYYEYKKWCQEQAERQKRRDELEKEEERAREEIRQGWLTKILSIGKKGNRNV